MFPDLTLLPAALLFFGSACLVVFSGVYLAKYGDLLADLTGWGRLWVGTLLVALATSLPELTTVITAVRLPAPELGTGNVFGANMVNMFTLAAVSLLFGAASFMRRVAPEQGYLAGLAISITGLAIVMGAVSESVSVASIGLGTLLIAALYVGGMRLVYQQRPLQSEDPRGDEPQTAVTLGQAWARFGLASAGVIAAAIFLAYSADQVAEATGLAKGFMGLVALAVVTTMPEATVTIASLRIGAVDLAVGNLYGSCAFNILLLAIADPFYREGPLLNTLEKPQVAGGLFAVVLMSLGMAQFLLRRKGAGLLPPVATCVVMCGIYLGGLYTVYSLS